MTRIEKCFQVLGEQNQKALVAFITAGDPDLKTTQRLILVIEKNGADIIEIGVPFTDPLADGPVILQSALRSLKKDTSLAKILQMVRGVRTESQIPIVLMSSYNPIFVYGDQKFVDDSVEAGVDGVIVPDLPPEEGTVLSDYAKEKGLDVIYLLAPTSTKKRIDIITGQSSGFIYYISLTGVTGMRSALADDLVQKIKSIRQSVALPLLIGFGISGPEQAAEAAKISDGVIVGSAIIKLIESNTESVARESAVGSFISSLKQAIT